MKYYFLLLEFSAYSKILKGIPAPFFREAVFSILFSFECSQDYFRRKHQFQSHFVPTHIQQVLLS
jgi:hypothetical protein